MDGGNTPRFKVNDTAYYSPENIEDYFKSFCKDDTAAAVASATINNAYTQLGLQENTPYKVLKTGSREVPKDGAIQTIGIIVNGTRIQIESDFFITK